MYPNKYVSYAQASAKLNMYSKSNSYLLQYEILQTLSEFKLEFK